MEYSVRNQRSAAAVTLTLPAQPEGRIRVCVIGAGAAGLCALRHFSSDTATFELAAFEQTDHIGGTWVYNENVGVDMTNRLPIHSSMYENLRTNLPSEIMNFPDWRKMGGGQRSCITHAQVLDYLKDYADHFDIRKYITFNTKIDNVRVADRPSSSARRTAPRTHLSRKIWKVQTRDLLTGNIDEKEFDVVICCNGHFFEPNLPHIPGMKTFSGQVLHSHDYRKPAPFNDKDVVILGASSSGADIGIELARYSRTIYLSHNMPRLASTLPENMIEKPGVSTIEGDRVFFKDGTSATADVFIYCTGYRYSFPFLDPNCGIAVDENYIHPLYKHLINVEYPTMCFVGIPASVVPFPMFDVQVRYFIAILKGRATLPSKEIMLQDSVYKTPLKKHAHRLAEGQWEYNNTLARDGGFDPLPPFYRAGYSAWKIQRSRNLMAYKEAKFIVADDGESVQIIFNQQNA